MIDVPMNSTPTQPLRRTARMRAGPPRAVASPPSTSAAKNDRHATSEAVSSVARRTNSPAVLHKTADPTTMTMPRLRSCGLVGYVPPTKACS